MVILQTCIISHKISLMCDVESKYVLHICGEKMYRIIPNKRAGRGDEVGGAFIMCTKMLIYIGRIQPRRHY